MGQNRCDYVRPRGYICLRSMVGNARRAASILTILRLLLATKQLGLKISPLLQGLNLTELKSLLTE